MEDPNKITYFAETDRRQRVPFGIKATDRSRHMYVIGKTGMGKSTLLENMAVQDIQNGNGMCFVDPHGKTAELLLEYVPKERLDDVIYFAPFDMDNPVSFNIMEDVGYDKRHLVANGLMSAFKKIWVDAWSARMEYILNNVILALLEYPDSTLLGVNRMLTDKVYRKKVVDHITDPSTRSFWVDEFAKYTDRYTQEATPAIQNKVGQFTANPLIRNIIGQPKSTFDLRKVMDEKKIVIINLSKGRIGEGNANLLGSMLITKLYLSAMSRADLHDSELRKMPNFYLFVDEFQSFANESFADILSEARKYKLNLTIAHQYIEQMPEEVRAAVFGNVGTMITFRVGAYDAEVLEKEFAPKFFADDLVNLGFTQVYLKLMIDGVSSQPFSATTLPPILPPEHSYKKEVIERSRELYARPRGEIEHSINEWYREGTSVETNATVGAEARRLPVHSGEKPRGQDTFAPARRFQQNLERRATEGRPQVNRETELRKKFERPAVNTPVHPAAGPRQQDAIRTFHAKEVPERSVSEPTERPAEKTPERMSLSGLRKKQDDEKEVPIPKKEPVISRNKDSLRDALKDVLEKQKKAVSFVPPARTVAPVPEHEEKKPEEKEKISADEPREVFHVSGAGTPPRSERPHEVPPREVPEDLLRKVLHVEGHTPPHP